MLVQSMRRIILAGTSMLVMVSSKRYVVRDPSPGGVNCGLVRFIRSSEAIT